MGVALENPDVFWCEFNGQSYCRRFSGGLWSLHRGVVGKAWGRGEASVKLYVLVFSATPKREKKKVLFPNAISFSIA
jgi:hypothetical protein